MSTFRFKKFDVINERSPMKVNTDGVLLGAWAGVRREDARVLDAGTGTGVIALMAAQRLEEQGSQAHVTGIDIDSASAEEAAANFAASPWADRLQSECIALQDFRSCEDWDLIVSNPPFFDNSLQAPDSRRNVSRHTGVGGSLSYRDLCAFASERLASGGRLAMVLPADQERIVLRTAASFGLYPARITRVRTTPSKCPARMLLELTQARGSIEETCLTIQDGGTYTSDYLALTREFYLFA